MARPIDPLYLSVGQDGVESIEFSIAVRTVESPVKGDRRLAETGLVVTVGRQFQLRCDPAGVRALQVVKAAEREEWS
jgi:hypothetical protein